MILPRVALPGAHVGRVLCAAAATGAFLGVAWQPSWQDAVEPAQVLAGLVEYPPDNPVYMYSTRTWTVLHQIPAVLLASGASERVLSLVLSGAMGVLSCQALALMVLALGGGPLTAVLAPPFIAFTSAASSGVTYPVVLMGNTFTYGIVGMSYLAATVALLGVGRIRAAALLAGFGPAVHVTIGVFGLVVAGLTVLTGSPALRRSARAAVPYAAAGVATAMIAGGAHYMLMQASLPFDGPRFEHWDEHRQPFPLLSGRALAAYLSIGIPLLWLWRFRDHLTAHGRDLLRALTIAALIAGALTTSYWLIPTDTPHLIPSLMPSRLLNLNVMACMAILIGLASRYPASAGAQAGLAALCGVLAGIGLWIRVADTAVDPARTAWTGMGVFAIVLAAAAYRQERRTPDPLADSAAGWRRGTVLVLVAALVAAAVEATAGFGDILRRDFQDRTNNPVFAAAAGGSGLLLTAGDLHLIQLRTRRPVLLDGAAIDALLYVPEAAPAVDRILRDVYGTSLDAIRQTRVGHLEEQTGRALWEARTSADWQEVGRAFSVTDVLTPAGWTLDLPLVSRDATHALYSIGARASQAH